MQFTILSVILIALPALALTNAITTATLVTHSTLTSQNPKPTPYYSNQYEYKKREEYLPKKHQEYEPKKHQEYQHKKPVNKDVYGILKKYSNNQPLFVPAPAYQHEPHQIYPTEPAPIYQPRPFLETFDITGGDYNTFYRLRCPKLRCKEFKSLPALSYSQIGPSRQAICVYGSNAVNSCNLSDTGSYCLLNGVFYGGDKVTIDNSGQAIIACSVYA